MLTLCLPILTDQFAQENTAYKISCEKCLFGVNALLYLKKPLYLAYFIRPPKLSDLFVLGLKIKEETAIKAV